jgi:proteasome component ECM29
VGALQIAVREAKRQNDAYRPHAVKALAQVAAARRDIDMHETVMAVVTPLLDEDVEGDPMDVDKDGSKASGAADT